MKKNLLPLLVVLMTNLGFAQTGSISIVSIPNQIEAGTTVDLQFTYTSDVTADFVVQLFETGVGTLAPDYGTWKTAVTVAAQPAGTDVPITVSFKVPGTVNPSSSLTNRQYTFDLKMTAVGSHDFGYSNGTADHTVEILPSSVVVDNINFTAATDATVNPGDNLSVSFSYTLADVRNVKAGLAIYNSTGGYVGNAMVGGTEVAQYYGNEPATTTTPVQQTATIAIPSGIIPSSQLPSGQVYKVVVTIAMANPNWTYITDKKNSIIVNDPVIVVTDNITFTGSTPTSINPGDNLSVSFSYTLADVRNVKAGLAIYNSTGGYVGNAMVGGTEVAQYYSSEPATTATPVQQTASIAIPSGIIPSSQLPSGQVYKIVVTIAMANPSWTYITDQKTDIIVNDPVVAVTDNIIFTAGTAATINPGENLAIAFEYTLSTVRNVKAGLEIYDAIGNYVGNAMDGSTDVAQYFMSQAATTATPVQQSVSIAIPSGMIPSSQLPAGQVYKVVITIATPGWSYIDGEKNDITVNDLATGLSNNMGLSGLNVFPNPTTEVVNVSYPGFIESINVYNASGSKMNLAATLLDNGNSTINTSTLENGVYILKVSTNEGTASVKLVK
jgi:hypothetical protein